MAEESSSSATVTTVAVSGPTRHLLRWWMSTVNQLALDSPSQVITLLSLPRARELWENHVLPPRIHSFQLGYFCGILTSLESEISPYNIPLSVARRIVKSSYPSLIEPVAMPVRAGELPSPQLVAIATQKLIQLAIDRPLEAAENFGWLLGLLWRPLHEHANSDQAVDVLDALSTCVATEASATSHMATPDSAQLVLCAGSGKRRIAIPFITTAATFVAACMARLNLTPINIVKPVSGGTSWAIASADALQQLVGNVTSREVASSMNQRFHLSFWRCEAAVPNFARLYHGVTFAPTVMSLCAPAVLACPVPASRIIYGLTDGPIALCARLLARLFPTTDILVLSGRDQHGAALLDEPSPYGPTFWAHAHHHLVTCGSGHLLSSSPQHYPRSHFATLAPQALADLLSGQAPTAILRMVAVEAALILDQRIPPSPNTVDEAHSCLGSRALQHFVEAYRQAARRFHLQSTPPTQV